MKYFAYGSNMSLKRFQRRVPSAILLGTFSLAKHQLTFHKVGMDGTAKCNAYFTGNTSNLVLGRLYEIDVSDKPVLDIAEGLGHGYEEKIIKVTNAKGHVSTAVTYYATDINNSLHPFTWYKQHVMIGAREAILPQEYIGFIESVGAIDDYDTVRALEQLSMHR